MYRHLLPGCSSRGLKCVTNRNSIEGSNDQQELNMSTVQISYNSVLMKPKDINPLAHPAYLNPAQKNREQNDKTIEQRRTDTITLSREAITKSQSPQVPEPTPGNKSAPGINASPASSRPQFAPSRDTTGTGYTSSSVDQLTLSSEALIKSSLFKALSQLAGTSRTDSD